jgi:hypothetical protein
MIRPNALTIRLEEWMLSAEFAQLIPIFEIETTESAASRGEVPRVWLNNYDESIFLVADGRPMDILDNLLLWFDDINNRCEVRINEDNYKDYDSKLFYSIKTNKYNKDDELVY